MPAHNFKDLINKKFNRLTVIKQIPNIRPKRASWLCQCDCGNFREAIGYDISKSKITQCLDCSFKSTAVRNKTRADNILPGKVFGNWRVTGRFDRKHLNCICLICGIIRNIRGESLSQGWCQCECQLLQDAEKSIGSRFNKLTIIEVFYGIYKKCGNRIYYKCQCDCGVETFALPSRLKSGHVKSCGCLNTYSSAQSARPRLRPFEHHFNNLITGAIRRNRKYEVTITYEDYVEFTKIDKCHYCDDVIFWHKHKSGKNDQPGKSSHYIDRKDNDIGYTKSNCVVCCAKCNRSKLERPYDEWILIGKAIKEYREKQGNNGR